MAYKHDIKDISDGKEIAFVWAGLYLNRNGGRTDWDSLFDLLYTQPRNVVYNFTVLCIQWFTALAKVSYYDDRNKASVMIGREMKDSLLFNVLEYRIYQKTPEVHFTMITDQEEDIVKMMSLFLKANHKDNHGKTPQEKFLTTMTSQHKTLQQSYSRLCFAWFDYLVKKGSDTNAEHIRLARLAAPFRESLPYI